VCELQGECNVTVYIGVCMRYRVRNILLCAVMCVRYRVFELLLFLVLCVSGTGLG